MGYFGMILVFSDDATAVGHQPGCDCTPSPALAPAAQKMVVASVQEMTERICNLSLGAPRAYGLEPPETISLADCALGYLPQATPQPYTWQEREAFLVSRSARDLRSLAERHIAAAGRQRQRTVMEYASYDGLAEQHVVVNRLAELWRDVVVDAAQAHHDVDVYDDPVRFKETVDRAWVDSAEQLRRMRNAAPSTGTSASASLAVSSRMVQCGANAADAVIAASGMQRAMRAADSQFCQDVDDALRELCVHRQRRT